MRFPLMFALLLCLAHCKNTTQILDSRFQQPEPSIYIGESPWVIASPTLFTKASKHYQLEFVRAIAWLDQETHKPMKIPFHVTSY